MMFWLVLLLLCGLAAAFAAAPLLFAARIDDAESRRDLNLALYRENVSDLVTDDADAAELEQEAQRALLQDTDGTDASVGTAAAGNSRKLLLATCLLVPVLGIIIYADFGAGRGAITDLRLKQELADFDATGPDAHRQLTEKLAARAEQRPEDAELSFFLARSYSVQGEYDKAATVYRRLINEYPNDAGLRSYYAESLFVADDRRMTERVREAMDAAMSMNPHDTTLLEIEGIAAVSEGRPREALDWFQKALATGVSGQRAELIRVAVSRLHNQLGLAGQTVAATPDAEDDSAMRVLNIRVSAADTVSLPPTSTVFVYARAAAGPPAPLAVQRLTLADLPATVRLDERMAMMEGMGLANFDSVVVIARASSTGGVTPSSGDFEARTGAIDMTSPPAELKMVIENPLP
jgi:cytochrome c-type biogenesis protein CcmH